MAENGRKTKIFRDILLVTVLLVASLVALLLYSAFAEDGEYVSVIINGVETERYPLGKDLRVAIKTEGDFGGENVLVIQNGKAKIESADCPDLVFARHSKISNNGESIVCLPHRLVIKIVTNEKSEVDVSL